ncbi:MAG: terminal-alkyne amino-acid exporter [Pseudonocardiales bacterium]|nr:terminal-alkyne amino-acid exporter [Pseudonocardiales bacterium]
MGTPRYPRASVALALTVVLWACAFPAIRVGVAGYGVAALSVLRLGVASVALGLAAPLLRVRLPRRADLPLIALCGLAGMSAYQLLLNWGEVAVPAGTASLLVSTAPVFSVLLAYLFLGERLGRLKLVGSAVALAGSAVIALAGGDAHYASAAWLVLAAAVVQGVYHCACKPLLRRYTGLEVACYAMWAGTLFLLPLAPAAIGRIASAPIGATVSVVFLGLLPSAVGFVTWGYAVARFTVTVATAALYLVPVVALAVAFGWLGERPRLIELVGGLVSIAGVALIHLGSRHPASAHSAHPAADPVHESSAAEGVGHASPGRSPAVAGARISRAVSCDAVGVRRAPGPRDADPAAPALPGDPGLGDLGVELLAPHPGEQQHRRAVPERRQQQQDAGAGDDRPGARVVTEVDRGDQ